MMMLFVCASVGGFGQIMFQVYLNYELLTSIALPRQKTLSLMRISCE